MLKFRGLSKFIIIYSSIFSTAWNMSDDSQYNGDPDRPGEPKLNKIGYAIRTTQPPRIDGILEDKVWQRARPITDFVQESPENLVPPTESTEVRLLFDDNFLYIYARLFDSDPAGIKKRIARRDDWMSGFEGSSDWFTFDLDSRYDHQTAFIFGVNAAGVRVDAVVFDDAEYDGEWNAVWDSAVNIDQQGWAIELAIPFSILRFDTPDNLIWGLNMGRYIQRKNEYITWIPQPRGVRGIVSRYGILRGLKDIPQPQQFEITPYVISGKNMMNGEELSDPDWSPDIFTSLNKKRNISNFGFDLKYGLGSNATLDITVNPDFGQIEADPANINLSYFETYFSEKRPFFMENSTLFDTPVELFYSRRIGSVNNRILAAGKITGKTASGLSLGIINAVTSRRGSSNWLNDINLDQMTSFFAGRVVQDVLEGNSYVGFMATSKLARNYNATTVSADQYLNLYENQLNLDHQIAISDTNGVSGWAYSGDVDYYNLKNCHWYFNYEYYSNGFYINDMGYNYRNGVIYLGTGISFLRQDPLSLMRYGSFSINYDHSQNLDELILDHTIAISTDITFMNYWQITGGFSRTLRRYDDKLTYDYELNALGPIVKLPESDGIYFSIQSDYTRSLVLSGSAVYGSNTLGDWGRSISIHILSRIVDRLEVSLDINRNRSFEKYHWLEITQSQTDNGGIENHYMFNESMNRLDIIQLRSSYGMTPNMSVDAYVEYYIYRNKFIEDALYELLTPRHYPVTTEYNPYSLVPSENELLHPNLYVGLFPKYTSLNLNLVFRWEFSPGSTLYLVYTNFKDINGLNDSSFGKFIQYQGSRSWTEFQKNQVIMLKIDYWFKIS